MVLYLYQKTLMLKSALEYLDTFISYEKNPEVDYNDEKFNLRKVKQFLEQWGIDYEELKFVHVAGSKGKGSVCNLIGRYLQSEGIKVGIFTSPHILSITERFWLNGANISGKEFCTVVEEFKSFVGEDCELTYFEVLFVLALKLFVDQGLEYAVLEVGIGGRLDATNIVVPELSILTTVELEHTEILGDTLEAIVCEKLGIVKENVPVLIGYQSEEALGIIAEKLKDKERVYFMHDALEAANDRNMKLAFTAIKLLTGRVDEERFLEMAAEGGLPGRLEVREIDGKKVVFDMAHTVNSAKALGGFLEKEFDGRELVFLFGMLKGKKVVEVFEVLKPLVGKITFTASHDQRGLSPEDLDEIWGGAEVIDNAYEAFEQLLKALKKDQVLVVTGSHFLLSEIYKNL
jgi:dihydrofolate synthase / folylpolyglutamate synthase